MSSVRLILKGRKHRAFTVARIGQQAQRLISMARHDHTVETLGAESFGRDVNPVCRTSHGLHGCVHVNAISEGRDQAFDILTRAAIHRAPLVLGVQAKESVVVPRNAGA